jgi:hypothetical protein
MHLAVSTQEGTVGAQWLRRLLLFFANDRRKKNRDRPSQ